MPMTYNLSHYHLNYHNQPVLIYHFNNSQHKVIDIIRDEFIDKLKPTQNKKKQIVINYKLQYYDKYHQYIDNIIKTVN